MRKMILMLSLLFLLTVFVGCSGNDQPEAGGSEIISYNAADLEMSLTNTLGNLVNISPGGKTIYAYFTGIN